MEEYYIEAAVVLDDFDSFYDLALSLAPENVSGVLEMLVGAV